MAVTWRGLTGFVSDQIAAIQSAASAAIDASVGSVTLAFAEANAGVALWLQGEVIQVLALTRAATSNGTDLDTFLADWSTARRAPSSAVGNVTLSRYTATNSVTILAGAQVSTGPLGQQYTIQADLSNPLWSAPVKGYVLAGGISSVTVPVAAVTVGSAGNVLPGTVTSFVTPILGIDTVVNSTSMSGGSDAATDEAARQMFRDYIGSLARGTPAAIAYAIETVSQTLTYSLSENMDTSGAYRPGWFVATIDDGTGYPSVSLLNTVATSIQSYRAIGINVAVQAPVVVPVIISMNLTIDPGSNAGTAASSVVTALTNYINALPIGQSLQYLRVAQLAFDASLHIRSVQNLVVNAANTDVPVSQFGVVKVATVSPTVLTS